MKNKNKKNHFKFSEQTNKLIVRLCFILILYCIAIIGDTYIGSQNKKYETVPYETFQKALQNGEVDTVYVDTHDMNVKYSLLNKDTKALSLNDRNKVPLSKKEVYSTSYPYNNEEFSMEVIQKGAQFVVKSLYIEPVCVTLLTGILSVIIPIYLLYLVMMKIVDRQLGLGTQGSLKPEMTSHVLLSDVIGQDEVIQELKTELSLMRKGKDASVLKVRPSKGILLLGPPGTGKTMIAKALANEAHMNFYYVNSSAFVDRFVGMGAKNIRDTFKTARENQPCILFFDEIDAVGMARDFSGGNQENIQTLNALLQELDGFKTSDQVFVIAATNREDHIDPALLRSGRFDRKITINPPKNASVREQLFKKYLENTCDDTVDLSVIAKQTAGFTGADIAQIANEAKLISLQEGKTSVSQTAIEDAIDKFLLKGNKTKTSHTKDLSIVAYHECGHALSMILSHLPVARISIIPNTSGVGGMVVKEDKDNMFLTKEELENEIISLYSGRAAEELIFGRNAITNGASNDILVAKDNLKKYVLDYGFSEKIGMAENADSDAVQEEINRLSFIFYNKAKNNLSAHLSVLKAMAETIMKEETMDGNKLTQIVMELLSSEK